MRERTVAMPLPERCRNPRCQHAASTRGLCRSCYQMAYDLVSQKVKTWAQLESEGKVSPRRRTTKEWLLSGVAAVGAM